MTRPSKKATVAARIIANRQRSRNPASFLPGPSGFIGGDQKHNHFSDFGFPMHLGFNDFYQMHERNGIAAGLVEQTSLETWQDYPEICENENPKQTPLETEIENHFQAIRFWQNIAEVDRRGMVGDYSAVILRLSDSKPFSEPVSSVNGGIRGLVEIIPAWEAQLTVAEWDNDPNSESYGKPKMYQFNESSGGTGNTGTNAVQNRQFSVHPDRVVIWSKTGTVFGRSKFKPCFNDLLTLQKIVAAGGEGFWKNAKSAPVLEADKDLNLDAMAASMGVPAEELADAMEEQVKDFNSGFDAMLMLKGMKAETLSVSLPIPEHFTAAAIQGIAASWPIPVKVLVGSQTGERASTEDARAWSKVNNARRVNICKPGIMAIIEKLVKFRILKPAQWSIKWSDLTESSAADKLARAKDMAETNAKTPDNHSFTTAEIREMAGKDPSVNVDGDDEDDE